MQLLTNTLDYDNLREFILAFPNKPETVTARAILEARGKGNRQSNSTNNNNHAEVMDEFNLPEPSYAVADMTRPDGDVVYKRFVDLSSLRFDKPLSLAFSAFRQRSRAFRESRVADTAAIADIELAVALHLHYMRHPKFIPKYVQLNNKHYWRLHRYYVRLQGIRGRGVEGIESLFLRMLMTNSPKLYLLMEGYLSGRIMHSSSSEASRTKIQLCMKKLLLARKNMIVKQRNEQKTDELSDPILLLVLPNYDSIPGNAKRQMENEFEGFFRDYSEIIMDDELQSEFEKFKLRTTPFSSDGKTWPDIIPDLILALAIESYFTRHEDAPRVTLKHGSKMWPFMQRYMKDLIAFIRKRPNTQACANPRLLLALITNEWTVMQLFDYLRAFPESPFYLNVEMLLVDIECSKFKNIDLDPVDLLAMGLENVSIGLDNGAISTRLQSIMDQGSTHDEENAFVDDDPDDFDHDDQLNSGDIRGYYAIITYKDINGNEQRRVVDGESVSSKGIDSHVIETNGTYHELTYDENNYQHERRISGRVDTFNGSYKINYKVQIRELHPNNNKPFLMKTKKEGITPFGAIKSRSLVMPIPDYSHDLSLSNDLHLGNAYKFLDLDHIRSRNLKHARTGEFDDDLDYAMTTFFARATMNAKSAHKQFNVGPTDWGGYIPDLQLALDLEYYYLRHPTYARVFLKVVSGPSDCQYNRISRYVDQLRLNLLLPKVHPDVSVLLALLTNSPSAEDEMERYASLYRWRSDDARPYNHTQLIGTFMAKLFHIQKRNSIIEQNSGYYRHDDDDEDDEDDNNDDDDDDDDDGREEKNNDDDTDDNRRRNNDPITNTNTRDQSSSSSISSPPPIRRSNIGPNSNVDMDESEPINVLLARYEEFDSEHLERLLRRAENRNTTGMRNAIIVLRERGRDPNNYLPDVNSTSNSTANTSTPVINRRRPRTNEEASRNVRTRSDNTEEDGSLAVFSSPVVLEYLHDINTPNYMQSEWNANITEKERNKVMTIVRNMDAAEMRDRQRFIGIERQKRAHQLPNIIEDARLLKKIIDMNAKYDKKVETFILLQGEVLLEQLRNDLRNSGDAQFQMTNRGNALIDWDPRISQATRSMFLHLLENRDKMEITRRIEQRLASPPPTSPYELTERDMLDYEVWFAYETEIRQLIAREGAEAKDRIDAEEFRNNNNRTRRREDRDRDGDDIIEGRAIIRQLRM